MLKNVLRSVALVFVLAAALGSLSSRRADAIVFCITECNNHQKQLCCGECTRFGCPLVCHPPTGSC